MSRSRITVTRRSPIPTTIVATTTARPLRPTATKIFRTAHVNGQ